MSQNSERWSILYKDEMGAAIQKKVKDSGFSIYPTSMETLVCMKDMLLVAVKHMRASGYDKTVCQTETKVFYDEYWDGIYGDAEGNLYAGEGMYNNLYQTLTSLTSLGYDVRPQWQQFRDLLKSIWVTLPDFYKGDTEYSFEKPDDYDPEKPFPNLPIPQDIDE
jgi:hypothetical protein